MNEMIAKILIIAFLVESIVLHEIAHGYVALLFGDRTAERQGRLTFNPIPHIDPLWTIVMPIVAYFLSGGDLYYRRGKTGTRKSAQLPATGHGRYLCLGCRRRRKFPDCRNNDTAAQHGSYRLR
jgi:hypothetical protein